MSTFPAALRVGDLVTFSPVPPVVSLSELEAVRRHLTAGVQDLARPHLEEMLAHYCLDDADTRAAFEVIISSLSRPGVAGDAFHVQGVYGSGKSHLLSALALLSGHPQQAWPVFIEGHAEYANLAAQFAQPRLVVAIALDEYPTQTHSLEYIVFASLERELAARHGVTAALTEQSHLLALVERYVQPQVGEELDRIAKVPWPELRAQDPERAATVALEYLEKSGFPLDWRRSRSEAWSKLQRALSQAGLTEVVILLDELGLFLAGKDRQALNADASFLQWLAQRTAGARSWLIVTTQRGFEEVGDVDRRTLRQLRDRFRAGLTLDLSDLEWVIRHKIAPRRDDSQFANAIGQLHDEIATCAGEELLAAAELANSYPLNPYALTALRRAAESWLSRTRSAVRLLQEAASRFGWGELPAHRLLTSDVLFDLSREELAMTATGRRHLEAYETIMANAARFSRGQERRLELLVKTLCFLGASGLRWTAEEIRAAFVGCEEEGFWQEPEAVRALLQTLYLRSDCVERARRGEREEYWLDLESGASEEIRRRLAELLAELTPEDSRVTQAALESCREQAFPLASLAEPRSLGVRWQNTRRLVQAECRELKMLTSAELAQQVEALAHPLTREDGCLFVASPLTATEEQARSWLNVSAGLEKRFAVSLAAWFPKALTEVERERLVEHAALSLMAADRSFGRRRGDESRQRLRERWAASEMETRAMLQRAYHAGRVIDATGRELVSRDRLWALFGDWEETLTAIFAESLSQLFPCFASIAPAQPLTSRLHTNQIVDQFVRPGEVTLPPASTLEAHLRAFAEPLGLVEGGGRRLRLALSKQELVQAVLAAVPARVGSDAIDPAETIAVGELVGLLAKGQWGLTREQGELFLAALLRTGHLIGLDAFLQPVRLEQIAAPLGDNLPFVMRGEPLPDNVGRSLLSLWEAAGGEAVGVWNLPVQEQVWTFFRRYAKQICGRGTEWSEAITRTAVSFGHAPEEWDWARESLAGAEALARAVDETQSSGPGLKTLAVAAERLPGAFAETILRLVEWRNCERFITNDAVRLTTSHSLISQTSVTEEHGVLARDRQAVLAQFTSPRQLIHETAGVIAASERWLESYRRHYLAWHARVHAVARFEGLAALRRSSEIEVIRRLGQAGLHAEEVAALETELAQALNRRCLAGDPLPAGQTVCPLCRLRFGEEILLPDAQKIMTRVGELMNAQLQVIVAHREMLTRRAENLIDAELREAVSRLLDILGQEHPPSPRLRGTSCSCPTELLPLLPDDVLSWLRQQLAQPTARKRDLTTLTDSLRGKELTAREVLRIVQEWLGVEGEEVVEVG